MRCNNCFEEYDEDLGVCPYCGYTEGQPPKELYMLFAGTVLQSRYIVGKVLGFGGFGITYKAYDTKLERMVAIKEYYPAGLVYRTPGTKDVVVFKGKRYKDYADGLKRFLDEARNATKFLDNPYIVDVMEFFEENSTAYFVMELFVGVTLDEFLKENGGRIDGESAVAIALSVGGALKDIHKAGYIHRDVAPDNIYMLSNGKIKLFDFGAARFSANETLSIVLKPGYAPAEQYDSVNKQGPWTDIYALGATMYRMVVGVKPDESTNRKMEDKVQPPHELIPEISENLSNAIMRAMSVEIHLRYQTIDEFMAAITSEKKVRSVESVRKRRKNFRWIGIASSVLIVAGLVTYFSRNWNKQKGEATLPDAKINVWYAEWWLDYTDYHYWHYHNKYPEGGGGIDSIGINSYGKCEFYSAAEGKQASDAPDKGGRGYGYCGLEEYHHCPYNWTAYWREKNYIYKRRPYKKIYTYSRTYTIYSYCDIRYYY